MPAAEAFETIFLRAFADTYVSEISHEGSTMTDLLDLQRRGHTIGIQDVLFVLKNGEVIYSEKSDADGSNWQVFGVTCHGDNVIVSMKVWCDRYKVRILSVDILGVENA